METTTAGTQIKDAKKKDTKTTEPIAQVAAAIVAEAEPGNRFMKLFTAIKFEPGDMREFEGNRGKKSVTLAHALIELANSGAYLTGTIYGRINPAAKSRAEFTWPGRANQSSIVCKDDPQAAQEMDEFKIEVARQYVQWSKSDDGKKVVARKISGGVEIDLSI